MLVNVWLVDPSTRTDTSSSDSPAWIAFWAALSSCNVCPYTGKGAVTAEICELSSWNSSVNCDPASCGRVHVSSGHRVQESARTARYLADSEPREDGDARVDGQRGLAWPGHVSRRQDRTWGAQEKRRLGWSLPSIDRMVPRLRRKGVTVNPSAVVIPGHSRRQPTLLTLAERAKRAFQHVIVGASVLQAARERNKRDSDPSPHSLATHVTGAHNVRLRDRCTLSVPPTTPDNVAPLKSSNWTVMDESVLPSVMPGVRTSLSAEEKVEEVEEEGSGGSGGSGG
eukprot:3921153-Rhodomonas_salina.2